MRHKLIRLLPQTDYDFSAVPISSSLLNIPVLQNIDVADWGGGTLLVRVHANKSNIGSSFRLDLRAVAPTDEDPATFFRASVVSTVAVSATGAVPALARSRLAPSTGSAVSLFLSVFQSANGGSVKFTISIDLYLEERAAGWTPADLGSKMTLWLDERDLVDVAGVYSDWGDESIAGTNDFTQATAGARPLDDSNINAFRAPRFDGSSTFMKNSNALSSLISALAYHVFVVFKAINVIGVNGTVYFNDGVIADQGLGWWGLYLKNTGSTYEAHGFHWSVGAGEAIGLGGTLNQDTLVEWSFDGTSIRCQVGANAIAQVTAAGGVGDISNPVGLGFGATGGNVLKGMIASVIVCNAYLTSAEAKNVRDYLSSRYGIPA